jgi:hypothetical protein
MADWANESILEIENLIEDLKFQGPIDGYFPEDIPFLKSDLKRLKSRQLPPELESTKVFLIESDETLTTHLNQLETVDDLEIFIYSLGSFINNKKIFGSTANEIQKSMELFQLLLNWDQGLRRARFPIFTFQDLAQKWIFFLKDWPDLNFERKTHLLQECRDRGDSLSQMPKYLDNSKLLSAIRKSF